MTIRQKTFNRLIEYIENNADTFSSPGESRKENEILTTLSDKAILGYDKEDKTIRLYSKDVGAYKEILSVKYGDASMDLLGDIIELIAEDHNIDIVGIFKLADFEEVAKENEIKFINELSERRNVSVLEVKSDLKNIVIDEFETFLEKHNNDFEAYLIASYIDALTEEF